MSRSGPPSGPGSLREAADSGGAAWPRVLVIDPDPGRRSAVARAIADCGEKVQLLDSGEASGGRSQGASAIAVVALESAASGPSDFGLIRRLGHRGGDVIAYGPGWEGVTIGLRCQVLLAGAGCLLDSSTVEFEDELRARVASRLRDMRQARAEQQHLLDTMAGLGIVGQSPVMLALFRWIARVTALSDVPVLISGDSGTGKELVARAIHRLDSKRAAGPFVPLNCGALSAGLAESELFGHKRGAFTGAAGDRRGLVRSADRGVLFLDEIGDLEVSLQGKLLRALQESRVLGVGEDREVAVSVRVIAATNRDLEQMVHDGRFRLDLYHRLNVLVARVPDLGERREDVETLVHHFLRKHGRFPPGTAPARPGFVAALARLELPGNVRQLENLVHRALVHRGDGGSPDLEDLPPDVWEQLARFDAGDAAPRAAADAARPTSPGDWTAVLDSHRWSLSRSLQACEKALLQAALERSRGNQSKTARLLGVTPRSIYNKVRRYQLNS